MNETILSDVYVNIKDTHITTHPTVLFLQTRLHLIKSFECIAINAALMSLRYLFLLRRSMAMNSSGLALISQMML